MYISVKEQTIIKTHLKVAKVVDGDGIIVTNLFNKQEEEIRLLGIDAPELRMCNKLKSG
jgi:micrococcal nuclease